MIPAGFNKIHLIVFDFDGVFTDNAVYVDQNGIEGVRCSRSDGIGLSRLKEIGIDAVVLSTEENPVVSSRCKKLKVACIQGISDKKKALRYLLKKRKIDASAVAFVGNDVNDIAVMEMVGFPIAVADAYPEVLEIAKWKTVCHGGFGAVREICDTIYQAQRNNA